MSKGKRKASSRAPTRATSPAITLSPPPPPPPPPSAYSTPPPPPPPLQLNRKPVSEFIDGDDFIRLDGPSVIELDESEGESSTARSRRPEPLDSRKRKRQEDAADNHRNVRPRIQMPQPTRTTPWMTLVDWGDCYNASEMLHREIKAFVEYISPTREEHEVRSLVIESIRRAVVGVFPDATLRPFGSFETKLYLPTGDIDLVLQTGMIRSADKRQAMFQLARHLRKRGIAHDVSVIAGAKVPIIKFVTHTGNLSVDISINQENGLIAGALMNKYLSAFPALGSFVFLLKSFLNQRGVNEVYSGGLGSYSTLLLCLSFLQMHPKVRRAEIDPSKNLGVLFNELLELYGKTFNYSITGISVLDGGSYFNKNHRGWDQSRNLAVAVEDPCDTTNDVSKGSFAMFRVREILAGANDVLSVTLFKRAESLRQWFARRCDYFDNSSLLGSIIGITDEAIAHRRLLNSIWREGTLHRQLNVSQLRDAGQSHHHYSTRSHDLSPKPTITLPGHPASSRRHGEPSPPPKPTSFPSRATSSRVTNGAVSFSMEEEVAMEESSEDEKGSRAPLVSGGGSGEEESRYSVKSKHSKPREVIYISDSGESDKAPDVKQDEGAIISEYEKDQSLLTITPVVEREPEVKPVSKPASQRRMSLQRKRDYWESKSGIAVSG